MAIKVKKGTVVLAALGAVGVIVFWFQAHLESPVDGPRPSPLNDGAKFGTDRVMASRDDSARPVAILEVQRLPSPMSLENAVSAGVPEMSLPPPPSGDYDLLLTAEQTEAVVESCYGVIFQTLGLSPDRLARLRSLLAERQQAAVDVANSAFLVGLNPVHDLPTIRRAIDLAQAPIDTTLRNELGESVFAACLDAASTVRERNTARDFARVVGSAREPLRPEQQQQLVQILKKTAGGDPPMDMDRAIYGGINDRARISDQAVAAAEKVLSSRQLELLRQLQVHGNDK